MVAAIGSKIQLACHFVHQEVVLGCYRNLSALFSRAVSCVNKNIAEVRKEHQAAHVSLSKHLHVLKIHETVLEHLRRARIF